MRPSLQDAGTACDVESLVEALGTEPSITALQSTLRDSTQGRYSFVAARPFLAFRAVGSQCELRSREGVRFQFGNPWHVLDALMSRYELLDELELPFPSGGCFGYWAYDLKNFVEPRLPRTAVRDLEIPDCLVYFYGSLVAIDHLQNKTWIIATGLDVDGSRDPAVAQQELQYWRGRVDQSRGKPAAEVNRSLPAPDGSRVSAAFTSSLSRAAFITQVEAAQRYIRAGDIYQVNLAQRLTTPCRGLSGWEIYRRLSKFSPAPFAAFIDGGDFQLASSSPERFLRLSGWTIQTRPIKGTRPRSADPVQDEALTRELETSPKERSELLMITDLMRNDLGRVCAYGSIQVPELFRLERYAQVQHLVSTVEGQLRREISHYAALAACFPGGSVTGAPKIRAMEIIDELEPVTRGPYTGCLGYLGFNRESQLSIVIRTACCLEGAIHFHAGAGIVADSDPAAEFEETLAKAGGLMSALGE